MDKCVLGEALQPAYLGLGPTPLEEHAARDERWNGRELSAPAVGLEVGLRGASRCIVNLEHRHLILVPLAKKAGCREGEVFSKQPHKIVGQGQGW